MDILEVMRIHPAASHSAFHNAVRSPNHDGGRVAEGGRSGSTNSPASSGRLPQCPSLQNPQGRHSLCSAVPNFLVRSEVERRPCVAYVWPLNMRAIVII